MRSRQRSLKCYWLAIAIPMKTGAMLSVFLFQFLPFSGYFLLTSSARLYLLLSFVKPVDKIEKRRTFDRRMTFCLFIFERTTFLCALLRFKTIIRYMRNWIWWNRGVFRSYWYKLIHPFIKHVIWKYMREFRLLMCNVWYECHENIDQFVIHLSFYRWFFCVDVIDLDHFTFGLL